MVCGCTWDSERKSESGESGIVVVVRVFVGYCFHSHVVN